MIHFLLPFIIIAGSIAVMGMLAYLPRIFESYTKAEAHDALCGLLAILMIAISWPISGPIVVISKIRNWYKDLQ